MGAERAVTSSKPGAATLHHFKDEIVAKIELEDRGKEEGKLLFDLELIRKPI